jgi:hypothetical protein
MSAMSRWAPAIRPPIAIAMAVCLSSVTLFGCERKERVLDVQTPGADIEVDRNVDTGEVEVDVEED